jgi:streptogramin lyase
MLGPDDDKPRLSFRRLAWIVLAVLLVIALAVPGAGIIIQYAQEVGIQAGLIPAPRYGSDVFCFWNGDVETWLDTDADGVYDPDEQALPDVPVHVRGANAPNARDFDQTQTDSQGEASFMLQPYTCPGDRLEVYVDVPAGMKLTTPGNVLSKIRGAHNAYSFGFTYRPGARAVTPPPPGPSCETYSGFAEFHDYPVTDLAVAPDGMVWASIFKRGVVRIDPTQGKTGTWTRVDGMENTRVNSVNIAPTGEVYAATDGGILRYADETWTTIVPEEPRTQTDWYMDIDPAGMLWVANGAALWRIDPRTLQKLDTWSLAAADHPDDPAWETREARLVFAAPDGTIWLHAASDAGVDLLHLFPPGLSRSEPGWVRYETRWSEFRLDAHRGGGPYQTPLTYATDIAAAPDGTLWFADAFGIAHFYPDTGMWTIIDERAVSTLHNTRGVEAIKPAPDGVIWLSVLRDEPTIYKFIPASTPDALDVWLKYDSDDGLPTSDEPYGRNSVLAIDLASDGALWLATQEAVTRCVFP